MLRSLGFADHEVFRFVPNEDLAPFVPAKWYGEDGYFGIGTGVRLDLSLNGVGIRSGELQLLRDRGGFEVRWAAPVTLLGRTRPEGEVTVFPSGDEGNLFGTIGALYFIGLVLALDPAGPHIGVSDREFRPPPGERWIELRMIGTSGLPVTTDVRLTGFPGEDFGTLFSSAAPASTLAGPLAQRLRGGRHELSLDDRSLEVDFMVGETPEYAVPVGADLQMVLGADVLRQFLTVLDFARGRVWMRGYPGAI